MYTHKYVYMFVRMYVCPRLFKSEWQSKVIFFHRFTTHFETESPTEPGASQFSWQMRPQNLPVFVSPTLKLQACTTESNFFCGF